MKKMLAFVIAPAFVAALSLDAVAQTKPTTTDRPASDRPAAADRMEKKGADRKADNRPVWQNTESLHASSDLIGTKVRDAQGKDLGEIDQLLIDPKSGNISHVVIGMGGMLGVGESKVVVPFKDIRFGAVRPGEKAQVTMDRATLDSAPRYERRAARDRMSPSASPATSGDIKRSDEKK